MSVSTRPNLEPAPDFRYAIEVGGVVTGWFTQCGGLSAERTLYRYEEGGLNAYVHQLPDRATRMQITLERGIADESLWRWFAGEADGGLHEAKVTNRDVTIILYNVDLTEARRWNLSRAYPVKWTAADLKAGDNQVAVEMLELAQGSADTPGVIQRYEPEGGMGPQSDEGQGTVDGDIDLTALANKVYKLLRRESRIERERMGWHRKR
jgi:phage tail-like protein